MYRNIFTPWMKNKVLVKDKILEFDKLLDLGLIKKEAEEKMYSLTTPTLANAEEIYLESENQSLQEELSIENPDLEIKIYMDKLHKYNDTKDVLQNMIGKIAELRNVKIKDLTKELGIEFEE